MAIGRLLKRSKKIKLLTDHINTVYNFNSNFKTSLPSREDCQLAIRIYTLKADLILKTEVKMFCDRKYCQKAVKDRMQFQSWVKHADRKNRFSFSSPT